MRSTVLFVLLCSACSSTEAAGRVDAGSDPSADVASPPAATAEPDAAAPLMSFCGQPAPSRCPTPKPSYSKDVARILDAKCNDCHVGGAGQPWSLADYQSVDDWRVSILQDILSCTMPPLDGGVALTVEERDVIAGWVACDAPNN
jgi:hypothetical protein